MNKEDKFIVTDATDIICIGGFGNDLGNIGLLKYNEQEIANMMIENNTQVDDIRLVNSLLNTIKKYKEVIEIVKELIIDNIEETTYEYIGSNKIKVLQKLIMDNDGVNELLDILKEVE